MSNCANHKKDILGVSDMKVMAEMIAELHYETLSILLKELSKKFQSDSRKDWKDKKIQLANRLKDTSNAFKSAYISMNEAWIISKPYMDKT